MVSKREVFKRVGVSEGGGAWRKKVPDMGWKGSEFRRGWGFLIGGGGSEGKDGGRKGGVSDRGWKGWGFPRREDIECEFLIRNTTFWVDTSNLLPLLRAQSTMPYMYRELHVNIAHFQLCIHIFLHVNITTSSRTTTLCGKVGRGWVGAPLIGRPKMYWICGATHARQTWQNSRGLQRVSQDLKRGCCNIFLHFYTIKRSTF